MRVTGVITQGAKRIGSPEYVKSYKVAYSDDGKTWRTYKVKGTDEDIVRHFLISEKEPHQSLSMCFCISLCLFRLYSEEIDESCRGLRLRTASIISDAITFTIRDFF